MGDHVKLPKLAQRKYIKKVYYEESEVTPLELVKWVVGVGCVGLLNMLQVSHFSCSSINTVCVRQILMLVNDGWLWLGS